MKSMTGYGKGEFINNDFELTIEIKTVNNRYLDLGIKEPKAFIQVENILRHEIAKYIVRGKADVFVQFRDLRIGSRKVELDMPLAKAYYDVAKELENNFPGIKNDFSVNSFMKIQDVIKPSSEDINPDELAPIIEMAVKNACSNLNIMREKEGEKIKADLLSRIETIKTEVGAIKERAPFVAAEYLKKEQEKIAELVGQNADEARILQEAALYADKTNIDEEITRLYSHIDQFLTICKKDGETGKQLDFLIQEFNRESNTICSKANDITITDHALKLKCEIEKIREQIQNLE